MNAFELQEQLEYAYGKIRTEGDALFRAVAIEKAGTKAVAAIRRRFLDALGVAGNLALKMEEIKNKKEVRA